MALELPFFWEKHVLFLSHRQERLLLLLQASESELNGGKKLSPSSLAAQPFSPSYSSRTLGIEPGRDPRVQGVWPLMDVAIVLVSKSVLMKHCKVNLWILGMKMEFLGLNFRAKKKKKGYFCKYLFQFWGETSLVDFWGLNFRAQKKVLT